MNKNIKNIVLGLQHLIAMFGATTLVPLLTGLDASVALFSAGVGTLIFHLLTKREVPVFLGSSFAFIPGIIAVATSHSLAHAQGGIVVAGALYIIFALLIYKVGIDNVSKFLPKYVIGTIIVIIGIGLLPVAVDMASANFYIATLTFIVACVVMFSGENLARQFVVLIAITVGYIVSFGMGLVDFTPITQGAWFAVPSFTAPQFDISAIIVIAPIVLATFMEHIGDITANGAVVGKDFVTKPGLHKTLLGDGIATMFAGFIGGPANTTYGENTGVLAITKNYNPATLRIAAVFAISLSFIGKVAGILTTIPVFVLGGVSIILFGMIAKVGLDTIITDRSWESKVQIAIMLFMLAVGLSGVEFISFSGVSLAAMSGILLNIIWRLLPQTNTQQ